MPRFSCVGPSPLPRPPPPPPLPAPPKKATCSVHKKSSNVLSLWFCVAYFAMFRILISLFGHVTRCKPGSRDPTDVCMRILTTVLPTWGFRWLLLLLLLLFLLLLFLLSLSLSLSLSIYIYIYIYIYMSFVCK